MMSSIRDVQFLSCLLLGAVALSGCNRGPRASASADPDGGHAKAESHEGDARGDEAYDESRTTRTGIYIDPKIAQACGVAEPETFFAFDSKDVAASNRDTLDQIASCLSTGALKGKDVVLVGHTDPRGTDKYNEELGKSRADSVGEYLKEKGVKPARIEAESHGEDEASPDANGWPRDRRVDILLDEPAKDDAKEEADAVKSK